MNRPSLLCGTRATGRSADICLSSWHTPLTTRSHMGHRRRSPSAVMIFAAKPDYVIVNRSQLGKHEIACNQRRHIEVPAIDTLPEADGQVGGGVWRRDFQVTGTYRAAAGVRPA